MASTYTSATNPFQVTTGSSIGDPRVVTGFGGWGGVLDVDNIRRKFGIGDMYLNWPLNSLYPLLIYQE